MTQATAAHLHIILVHVPTIGMPFMLALLLIGLWWKSRDLVLSALAGTALIAVLTIPPYLLGDSAEELFKKSENIVEEHEEAAEVAFVCVEATGLIAMVSLYLYYRRHRYSSYIMYLVFVALVSSSALLVWASNLGGKIAHREIYSSMGPMQSDSV